ncbi:MAG: hypothetical protein AAGK32_17155 [Actinomycetota bacterium]
MAAPQPQPQPSPRTELPEGWSVQAADTVVDLVDNVRSKTTGPLLTAAKAVVYGVIALVLGIVVLVLLAIALMRIINVYLPNDVWLAYLLVGSLFTILGAVVWTKRAPTEEPA